MELGEHLEHAQPLEQIVGARGHGVGTVRYDHLPGCGLLAGQGAVRKDRSQPGFSDGSVEEGNRIAAAGSTNPKDNYRHPDSLPGRYHPFAASDEPGSPGFHPGDQRQRVADHSRVEPATHGDDGIHTRSARYAYVQGDWLMSIEVQEGDQVRVLNWPGTKGRRFQVTKLDSGVATLKDVDRGSVRFIPVDHLERVKRGA